MNNVHFAVILLLTPPARKQPTDINPYVSAFAALFKKGCDRRSAEFSPSGPAVAYARVPSRSQIIQGSPDSRLAKRDQPNDDDLEQT
jgi:hypothetical protein